MGPSKPQQLLGLLYLRSLHSSPQAPKPGCWSLLTADSDEDSTEGPRAVDSYTLHLLKLFFLPSRQLICWDFSFLNSNIASESKTDAYTVMSTPWFSVHLDIKGDKNLQINIILSLVSTDSDHKLIRKVLTEIREHGSLGLFNQTWLDLKK